MRWSWLKNCWYLVTEICYGWYLKQYISKGNFTFLYDNDLPSAGKSWNYLWAVPRIPSLRRCHGISSKSFSPREFVDLMSQGKKTKCIYFFRRWKKDSRTGTAKSKTSKKIHTNISFISPPRSGMQHFVQTSYPDPGSKMLRSLKRQRTGRISQISDNKNIPTFVLPLKGEWNSYHLN